MENKNYIKNIKKKKASLYRISERTGIPYTTLSKLKLGKLDINKCAAEVVMRLAWYFECPMEKLLNLYPLMAGVHGTYKGCHYRWVSEAGNDVLYVKEGEAETEIDRNIHITDIRFREDADTFTRMAVEIYLEKKEADTLCKSII